MSPNRREFIKQSTAASVALAIPGIASATLDNQSNKFDSDSTREILSVAQQWHNLGDILISNCEDDPDKIQTILCKDYDQCVEDTKDFVKYRRYTKRVKTDIFPMGVDIFLEDLECGVINVYIVIDDIRFWIGRPLSAVYMKKVNTIYLDFVFDQYLSTNNPNMTNLKVDYTGFIMDDMRNSKFKMNVYLNKLNMCEIRFEERKQNVTIT